MGFLPLCMPSTGAMSSHVGAGNRARLPGRAASTFS